MKKYGMVAFLFICFLFFPLLTYAQIVTGVGYLANNTAEALARAQADARKDAMRSLVESTVGVNVKAESMMENFVLVKDRVTTRSDGYVLIKKVSKPVIKGDVVEVTMDLEVNKNMMDSAIADPKQVIENLTETSSRSGIDIAIVDDDHAKTNFYSNVFAKALSMKGFYVQKNDAIIDYLSRNLGIANDMQIDTEVRRIGKLENRMDANAVLRGRVGIHEKARKVGGKYRAVAKISCEIISYDNNDVDATSLYEYGYGNTPQKAEADAKEIAVMRAIDELGQQVLKTIQRETRGGAQIVKSLLVFPGVTDVATKKFVLDAIRYVNCRVIRTGIINGGLQVFVTSTDFYNVTELAEVVENKLRESYPNVAGQSDSSVGATKIFIKLWG